MSEIDDLAGMISQIEPYLFVSDSSTASNQQQTLDSYADDIEVEEFLKSVEELTVSADISSTSTTSSLTSSSSLLSSSQALTPSDPAGAPSSLPRSIQDIQRMEAESIGNYKMLWDPEKSLTADHSQPIGGLLSPKLLAGVSKALRSPSAKNDLGTPKCLAISRAHFAIGTSHGFALVFDHTERLSIILGADVTANGPVCSLDIWDAPPSSSPSPSSESAPWLVCGYANGHVIFWDYLTGAKIKSIEDAHRQPVVHLRFLHDHKTILSADVSGAIFQFALSSLLFMHVVNTTKILNGAAGPVFALQPLPRLPLHRAKDIDFLNLVAFSTKKRTLILALYPRVKILATLPAPDPLPPHSLPSLAWLRRGSDLEQPVLCVSWAKSVECFKVSLAKALAPQPDSAPGTEAAPQIELAVSSLGPPFAVADHVTGIIWLASDRQQLVLVHTVKDEFLLVDPVQHRALDCFSAKPLHLAYHTRFAGSEKPIPALCSYYASFAGSHAKIYILGVEGLFSAHLMSWRERIASLQDSGRWLEALTLASGFYSGHLHPGSSESLAVLQEELAETIDGLISSYVDFALTPSTQASDLRRFRLLGSMCIDLCQRIGRTYNLFTRVFQQFIQQGHQDLFLELLEPYILNDRLNHLSPEVMQAFIIHYSASPDMLRRVERCITRLDIPSLDFDQVIRLAIRHNLSTALIYMHNFGLEDFITPLQLLLSDLNPKPNNTPASAEALVNGYKLLLYLNYIFRGRAYPTGQQLPDRRLPTIKKEVLDWLFAVDEATDASRPAYQRYSHLFSFIRFDCHEFLSQILRLVFLDQLLPVRTLDGAGKQGMADILYSVILPPAPPAGAPNSRQNEDWPFDDSHALIFYTFLVPFVCDKTVAFPNSTVFNMIYLLITFPLDFDQDSRQASLHRQKLIEDLLISQKTNPQLDLDRLLTKAQHVNFHRVAKYIYLRKGLPEKAVVTQLTDPQSCGEVFEFIVSLIRDASLPQSKRDDVKSAVLSSLPRLININSDKTCRLMLQEFAHDHEQVVSSLRAFPKLEYRYLQSLVNSNDSQRGGQEDDVAQKRDSYSQGDHFVVNMRPEEVERYVELMCKYEPLGVHPFLMSHESYRLEKCLDICKAHKVNSATAYLLERMGDSAAALQLLLLELEILLNRAQNAYTLAYQQFTAQHGPITSMSSSDWHSLLDFTFGPEKNVQQMVAEASDLCKKNIYRLEEHEYEALWFGLMDKLVIPLRRLKLSESKSENEASSPLTDRIKLSLLSHIRRVLENMMGNVPLTAILDKIVRDHGRDQFGDFKPIISSMLDTYSYERNILETANHLLQFDAFSDIQELQSLRTQAFVPLEISCLLCHKSFGNIPTSTSANARNPSNALPAAAIFRCGHGFHAACLGKCRKCPLCYKPDENITSDQSLPAPNVPQEASTTDLSAKTAVKDINFHLKRLDKLTRNKTQSSRLLLFRSLPP